jgi:citrate synthase
MKLMFEIPTGPYKASPVVIEALINYLFFMQIRKFYTTVRMVGSSHAGLFASISSEFQTSTRRSKPGGS